MSEGGSRQRRRRGILPAAGWGRLLLCLALLVPAGLWAAHAGDGDHDLTSRLTPAILQEIYPGAERAGPAEGSPPAAAVFVGEETVGYVFSTLDVVAAVGYTTTPFDVLGGVTNDGTITGMKVVFHKETIFNRGVPEQSLFDYLSSLAGYLLFGHNKGMPAPDVVHGGTITARAMRNAVFDSAKLVLRDRTDRVEVTEPTLDREGFRPLSWTELLASGAIARRTIANDEVRAAFSRIDATPPKETGEAGEPFLDLFVGLADLKGIGQNLFGNRYYPGYMKDLADGGHALFVGATGRYSFRGLNYHKREFDYLFDRLRIVQGDTVIQFHKPDHRRVGRLVGDAKADIRDSALFFLPADSGLDPLKPWTLELGVEGEKAGAPAMLPFEVAYAMPADFIMLPPPVALPAWLEPWRDGLTDILTLAALLVAITLTAVFQSSLTRHRRLYRGIRLAILAVVLGWLGLVAGGQLTIVNVINYLRAPFDNLPLEFYLRDPLLVMIVVYTVVTVLILGRGLFCGWLCPFGALQEFLFRLGRFLRLPAIDVGGRADRLLRPMKYVALAILAGLALYSGDTARVAAEVEPFKTVIISQFDRSAPYVAYALFVLGTGLFVERAFCRFLCPLGATLAVLGRLRLTDHLPRRLECGSPCNLCRHACPVKAIEKSGAIDMNECLRCLDCQVEYNDPHRCPPLAKLRKAAERKNPFPQPEPAGA